MGWSHSAAHPYSLLCLQAITIASFGSPISCIGTIPPAHPDNSCPAFSLSGQDEHYLTDALFSLLECLLVGKERLAQETARQSHHPAPPIASETDIAREPLETWYRQLPLQGKYIAGEDVAEV